MSGLLPHKGESRAKIRDVLDTEAAESELSKAELGECIQRLSGEQPEHYWSATRRRREVLELLGQYHEQNLERESRPTTNLRQNELYYLADAIRELADGDGPDREVTISVDD